MDRNIKKTPIFQRPPRFIPEMPQVEIEIPNPPAYVEKPEISWFSLLVPSLVMLVITILVAINFQSIYMLISIVATITTVIGSVVTASNQIKKYQREKANRETMYRQVLVNLRNDLEIYNQQQINAMNQLNPPPVECIERIEKIDSKLWERTPSHNDFLSLRLGVGSVPSTVKIAYTKQSLSLNNDPLADEPEKLALEFERVNNVPVLVDLFESEICGLAGSKDNVMNTIGAMLLQLITHHSYEDVKIVLLISEDELQEWQWTRYLPHIWSSDLSQRYMACGPIMANRMLRELYDVLKERELKSNREDFVGNISNLPQYVFIISDATLLENQAIAKYLYQGNKNIGVSSIFLAERQEFLPMNCKTVITVQNKTGIMAYKDSGTSNDFLLDEVSIKNLEIISRKLFPIRMKQSQTIFSLPKFITLMDMLKIKKVEELDIISNWKNNKTYKGMSVPIGVKVGKELFNLDIQSYETSHGPHGLVAGTTGSGKSELLQSLIVSLAINYHPHDVVFVLIDYKGGGMADVFEGMPHLVGTITNLDGNQTTRALISIKSELKRRQEIFSKYKVNNIDKYQKLYHTGQVKEDGPIPHLIMIADEFAELKAEQPDFMKELISTARVGRSLGVHLILATQKPAGVVDDQIWSNSRFKICLKVQDEGDSKDVIKRPDAAMIKEPGRAYIQVGNDEIFELFQSAWSGAEYSPEDEQTKRHRQKKYLYKVDLLGRTEQIYPMDEDLINDDEKDTQLKVVVDYIIKKANKLDIVPLKGPWLSPLQENIYLDDIFKNTVYGFDFKTNKWEKGAPCLSPVIGILDNPRDQIQEALYLDFAKEGHLFVYGAPGTGKTTLLQTLIMSLANTYSPREVNMYIMDFGGGALKNFEKLPHCGGVMTIDEEETINQFMLFVFRLIESRKTLFEGENVGSYISYLQTDKVLPGIFLFIDNYFALSETYEEIDDKMIILAREGMKYGIYIIATATNVSFVKYKFSVNFKMAIALQLTEKMEYDSVVGRTDGLEPSSVLGRGLIRNRPPLEFQTALPIFREQILKEIKEEKHVNLYASKESYRAHLIQKNIESYKIGAKGNIAPPIPKMPNNINMFKLAEETKMGRFIIPIGKNDDNLEPVLWDINKNPYLIVAGHIQSGKSTIVKSWIQLLAKEYSEEEVEIYAIDSNSMGLYEIMGLPHIISVNELKNIDDLVEMIKRGLDIRRNEMNECKKARGDMGSLYESWKQIIFAIDNLNEFTDSGHYGLKELMERIVKKEYGLKISIIAIGNINDLESNWDPFAKALRECQVGLLLGSLKEQNIFNARLPYGSYEKDFEMGDGYFINKNKYVGLRTAYCFED